MACLCSTHLSGPRAECYHTPHALCAERTCRTWAPAGQLLYIYLHDNPYNFPDTPGGTYTISLVFLAAEVRLELAARVR